MTSYYPAHLPLARLIPMPSWVRPPTTWTSMTPTTAEPLSA
jgi:hypothetical protein